MKLSERYAHALLQASQEKNSQEFDAFFESFVGYLTDHHHEKLLNQILAAVERLSASTASSNKAIVTVREEGAEKAFKDVIAAHTDTFSEDAQVRIDPNIIGGVVIRNRTSLLDASHRTGLLKLYESLRK